MTRDVQTLLPPELAKVKEEKAVHQEYYCALKMHHAYEDEWYEEHEVPLVFCKGDRVLSSDADTYAFKVQDVLPLKLAMEDVLKNNFHYSGRFSWGVFDEHSVKIEESGQKMSQIKVGVTVIEKFGTKDI
jgi:hypothetical protein